MLIKDRNGFNIIEMLIVIAILGVLVMVGLISYGGMSSTTNTTKCRDNMRAIRNQLQTFYLVHRHYPAVASFPHFLNNTLNADEVREEDKDNRHYFVDKEEPACVDSGFLKYDYDPSVEPTSSNKAGIPPSVKCYGTAHGSLP